MIITLTIEILIIFISPKTTTMLGISSSDEYTAFRVKTMSLYISDCIVVIFLAIYLNLVRNRLNLNKLWVSVFLVLLIYISLSFLIQGSKIYGWYQRAGISAKALLLLLFIPLVYVTFNSRKLLGGGKIA